MWRELMWTCHPVERVRISPDKEGPRFRLPACLPSILLRTLLIFCAGAASPMRPILCPRRRRRNRPSLHPRIILIRQLSFKLYSKRKYSNAHGARTYNAYARTATCFFTTVLSIFLALSYISPCTPTYAHALLCYAAYTAASLVIPFVLPSLEDACKWLGINGKFIHTS